MKKHRILERKRIARALKKRLGAFGAGGFLLQVLAVILFLPQRARRTPRAALEETRVSWPESRGSWLRYSGLCVVKILYML